MPAMRTLVPSWLALLLVLPTVSACDSSKESKASPDDAAAKKAAEEDEAAKKVEERRKKREAEEAAKKKAEEDRKAQIEALCVIPKDAKKPKKLDKACEDLAKAQMSFFERQYADDPTALERMKASAPLQKANMMKMCTSMDIAVGLKHAFDNAPPGMASATNDLIATCIQKFGQPQAGESAVPGKPQ